MAHTQPAPEGTANPTAGKTHSTWQRVLSIGALAIWIVSIVLIQFAPQIPDRLIISGTLGAIALATFAAFYSATGTEGTRTAIAATLVVFYLVLITHLIAAPSLRNDLDTPTPVAPVAEASPAPVSSPSPDASPAPGTIGPATTFGRDIFNGLTEFVKIVLLFYFTAVTVEKTVSSVTTTAQNRAETQAAAQTESAAKNAEAAKAEQAAAESRLATAQLEARTATKRDSSPSE